MKIKLLNKTTKNICFITWFFKRYSNIKLNDTMRIQNKYESKQLII